MSETEQDKKRYEEINNKYRFFSLNEDYIKVNHQEINFLLLTEEDLKILIKRTCKRAREQNKELKKIGYAGFINKNGEEII